ncbi:hypothetical protein CYLTODRAFT_416187 [Cylindrobasidium torrendii FP15055 ss-10]|uniref:GILT-domain-containing protein n=1 Tax=Cylindrobasidium torrendii FP15055 ss-10 TaxID=1314674 RepID=A0A0D7BVA3_9AGAR|nr:hypothetical protein CYLTODRAFT_416187 [Cylindrobasidium torrendii FP15055 ss-10]
MRTPSLISFTLFASFVGASFFDQKVAVTLGVMSRCPDALACEAVWNDALPSVKDKADISLTFLATPNASDTDYGVVCKHGPGECGGNIQQLCIQKHGTFDQLWQYVQCSNFEGKDQVGLRDVAQRCATTAGFAWEDELADCVGEDLQGKTDEGRQLLAESAAASKKLNIVNSCTVLINEKIICVRDGTWKTCEGGHEASDFIRQVNEEYNRTNDL